ncbi:hypothetical protein [Sphingomonas sp. MMS24-J13]|uniref:hypothetical protein n=1 Tax=Sphingomonas sp. MMS24-J13 TaxID=3238686 RepID=UPI00384F351C
MLLMALVLAQATVPVAAPPAAPTTLQIQFDRANVALGAEQWQQAYDGFTAAETWPGASARSRGIAQLGKGLALLKLRRIEDATAALRSGLALTSNAKAAAGMFRVEGALQLAQIDFADYDYEAARALFELVLAESKDVEYRQAALLGLVQIDMFDDPKKALAEIDDAIAMADPGKKQKTSDATLRDMRGRVLMNSGDYAGAIRELNKAVADQGGVTSRTDISDVVVRSDLAIANSRAGHSSEAHQLMAMTGAGRMPDDVFARAAQMDLPPCTDALRPDDVAVIEFGVNPEGAVFYAAPIYASRVGMPVLDLARAVRNWAWRVDDIARVPLFYRTATRVEIRCSTAVDRPAVSVALMDEVSRWFTSRGAGASDGAETDPSVASLRADIERAGAPGGNPALLIRLLGQLGDSKLADYATRTAALRRALDLAQSQRAAPAVIAWLLISQGDENGRQAGWRAERIAMLLRAASTAEFSTDARARAALILVAADLARHNSDGGATIAPHLAIVAHDDRLDAHDPLRVGALLRLSNLQAKAGDLTAARASYLGTGLNSQQCALVDAQPAMKRQGLSSKDYPDDIVAWGVSGWSRVEFDITADGMTTRRRAILSYPPFIFDEVAAQGIKNARYTQSYRPEGGLGCGGATINVNFYARPDLATSKPKGKKT